MKLTWASLHDIGTSKIVNTSFIWLAIIPFLSRALDALHAADTRIPTLPLNFSAFYFAAFFFAIGALIFRLHCPTVIKLAPNFAALKAGNFSTIEFRRWFVEVAPDP